jgi:hypothetical protein
MICSKKIILAVLFFSTVASASMIKVGVRESFGGNDVFFMSNISENLVKFSTEFYNTGTIPYKARIRVDVFDYDKYLFSGWSKEKPLMPGGRDYFEVFWYSEKAGNFTALLKAYFGNEIVNYGYINVTIGKASAAESTINISAVRMSYDDIALSLNSNAETVIIPYNYPYGWIFEQEITSRHEVTVRYEPSLWVPGDVSFYAVSPDGRHYGKATFRLDVKESVYDKLISILGIIIRTFVIR